MDGTRRRPDTHLVRLGEAIAEALTEATRSQKWLAEAVGIDQGSMSKIVKGTYTSLRLDQIRAIEEALGLEPGELLRAGGYVADGCTVPAAIRADTSLSSLMRQRLLGVYDSFVVATAAGLGRNP